VYFPATALAAPGTLEAVRQHGALRCGINASFPGFSTKNSLDEYAGFDIDLCRALAAAALGDSAAVEFVVVSDRDRFVGLKANDFDVLMHSTTYTLSRNARFGLFTGIGFFDGQGIMVHKRTGVRISHELDNVPICVRRDSLTEASLQRFFKLNDLRYNAKLYNNNSEVFAAYDAGECSAVTANRTRLAARRTSLTNPDAHSLLPDILSKRPLGPVVRDDDVVWAKIVSWSLHCLVNAEESGLSSQNLSRPASENNPGELQLLGKNNQLGPLLGLDAQWCANIVDQVGNYAEIYERNFGPDTPLALERGINRLWTKGGLLYALPFR
jgi:general L-amino acid transport system substrate-binding protein